MVFEGDYLQAPSIRSVLQAFQRHGPIRESGQRIYPALVLGAEWARQSVLVVENLGGFGSPDWYAWCRLRDALELAIWTRCDPTF